MAPRRPANHSMCWMLGAILIVVYLAGPTTTATSFDQALGRTGGWRKLICVYRREVDGCQPPYSLVADPRDGVDVEHAAEADEDEGPEDEQGVEVLGLA